VDYIIFRVSSADLDISRDELFKDIMGVDLVSGYEKKQFVDNSKGNYYEKGKYITDGKAYLIYLK